MNYLSKNCMWTAITSTFFFTLTDNLLAKHAQMSLANQNERVYEVICKREVDDGYFVYGYIDGRWQAVFEKNVDELVPECQQIGENDPPSS